MSGRIYHHRNKRLFIEDWTISAGRVTGMLHLRDCTREFSVRLRSSTRGRYILLNVGCQGSSCNIRFDIPESVS